MTYITHLQIFSRVLCFVLRGGDSGVTVRQLSKQVMLLGFPAKASCIFLNRCQADSTSAYGLENRT